MCAAVWVRGKRERELLLLLRTSVTDEVYSNNIMQHCVMGFSRNCIRDQEIIHEYILYTNDVQW